jgi:hypothetical protein
LSTKLDNIDDGNRNNTIYILAMLVCFWQSQTMQMMYNIVARELATMQLVDSHPQHYLNFYCLGNREDTEERLGDNADKVIALMEISFLLF